MSGITLQQAQDKLDEWMAADTAVAGGQSYTIADRNLTRADGKLIRSNIEYWDAKVKELSLAASGATRSRSVSPGW